MPESLVATNFPGSLSTKPPKPNNGMREQKRGKHWTLRDKKIKGEENDAEEKWEV